MMFLLLFCFKFHQSLVVIVRSHRNSLDYETLSFHTSVIGDRSVVSHNFMVDEGSFA